MEAVAEYKKKLRDAGKADVINANTGWRSTPKKPVPAVKVQTSVHTLFLIVHVTKKIAMKAVSMCVYVCVGCDSQSTEIHWSLSGTEQLGAGISISTI